MNRRIPLPVALALLLLIYAALEKKPVPPPAPIQTDKLVVAVIEESSERGKWTKEQLVAVSSPNLRKIIADAGGEFRLIDADDPTDFAPPWVRAALAIPRTETPWLIVAGKSGVHSGPLPKTLEAILAEVAKYGK